MSYELDPVYRSAKTRPGEGLGLLGVDFPHDPIFEEFTSGPRQWLLRGESSTKRLITHEPFCPTSGEWASWGVFWGDCMLPIPVYSRGGVYYLVRADLITGEFWIVPGSEQWERELNIQAKKQGLDLRSIRGGFHAMNNLYRSSPVYHKQSGVCTVPHEVSLTTVERVLVSSETFAGGLVGRLDPSMRPKIAVFPG